MLEVLVGPGLLIRSSFFGSNCFAFSNVLVRDPHRFQIQLLLCSARPLTSQPSLPMIRPVAPLILHLLAYSRKISYRCSHRGFLFLGFLFLAPLLLERKESFLWPRLPVTALIFLVPDVGMVIRFWCSEVIEVEMLRRRRILLSFSVFFEVFVGLKLMPQRFQWPTLETAYGGV